MTSKIDMCEAFLLFIFPPEYTDRDCYDGLICGMENMLTKMSDVSLYHFIVLFFSFNHHVSGVKRAKCFLTFCLNAVDGMSKK